MRLRVRVAELDVQLDIPASFADSVRKRFGPYIVDTDSGELLAQVEAWDGKDPGVPPILEREDLTIWADAESRRLLVRPGVSGTGPGAIERAVRFAYAAFAPVRDGLLLHASAVATLKGAVAFAGASGAGKSTVARLFPADSLLSDDTIVVRRSAGKWLAWATPFVNDPSRLPQTRGEAIWRMFVLEKSSEDRVESLSPVEKFACLLANVIASFPGADSSRTLDLVGALSAEIPLARLRRTRDASPRPFLADGVGMG